MARLMVVKHLPNVRGSGGASSARRITQQLAHWCRNARLPAQITKVDAVLIKDDDRQRAAEL